jgi:hypothetical protein
MSKPIRPEVVELIADCFRNHDTNDNLESVPSWRHENGILVTAGEISTIRNATLREVFAAHNVVIAEHTAIFGAEYRAG